MALLELKEISLGFGGPKLLNGINLTVEEKEKVALIGRNGEGKSTLLKIISGEIGQDSGDKFLKKGATIGYLTQDVPLFPEKYSIIDLLLENFPKEEELFKAYYQSLDLSLSKPDDNQNLTSLTELQLKITEQNLWDIDNKIQEIISRCHLENTMIYNTLSTGQKRRALLAKALIAEPDLLILDEPTNHLDIETILWLEDLITRYKGSLLFVTHDRFFLNKFATRIIELDRGKAFSWAGNYDKYLADKEHWLKVEAEKNEVFDKKLKEEEAWLRRGIKARRTRNEGRVRALKSLREERSQRRNLKGSANLQAQQISKSGKKVIKAENLSFGYSDKLIVKDLSLEIIRGDKLGIVGPNGCGKSTVIKLLVGELVQKTGSVTYGTNLEVAYFDQNRVVLDPEKSVKENVSPTSDTIFFNGRPRHIVSYLGDFLFESEKLNTPVKALSGGERNRLLLAKVFSIPANLLILDEPTNDLDMETLELLESLLVEYEGTIIFISHDRSFLNNVATGILNYEGNAFFKEYSGGYEDLERVQSLIRAEQDQLKIGKKNQKVEQKEVKVKTRLTFKEKKELEELPVSIELLEEEKEELITKMGSEEIYSDGGELLKKINSRMAEIDKELESLYDRWEHLESYEK